MNDPTPALSPLLARLRATFGATLGPIRDCALIDFPDHANVGDSAIWLGEIALLQDLGVRIRHACALHQYSAPALRRALPPGATILIHGGGNFGTLWPRHQQLRESLLQEFPDYRVVQLPQSIHYSDRDSLDATARVIANHPDFTLMVRDEASYRIAADQLRAKTVMSPDAALALAGTLPRVRPEVDCFVLARTDKEQSGIDLAQAAAGAAPGLSVRVDDWLAESHSRLWRLASQARARLQPGTLPLSAAAHLALCNAAARHRVTRGVRMLGQGRSVVTDRLHGMILSACAGIPCVALDNNYGKVSAFHHQWFANLPDCVVAASVPQAMAQARALRGMPAAAPGAQHRPSA